MNTHKPMGKSKTGTCTDMGLETGADIYPRGPAPLTSLVNRKICLFEASVLQMWLPLFFLVKQMRLAFRTALAQFFYPFGSWSFINQEQEMQGPNYTAGIGSSTITSPKVGKTRKAYQPKFASKNSL